MYKGKHNDELFSLIDDIDESLGENNSFNSYHNPGALTPEEVLAQNAASEADNEPTGALEALKKRMLSSMKKFYADNKFLSGGTEKLIKAFGYKEYFTSFINGKVIV